MEFGVRELIQFGTLLASLAGAFAVVKSQVSRLIEDIAKLQSYANKLENRLEITEIKVLHKNLDKLYGMHNGKHPAIGA